MRSPTSPMACAAALARLADDHSAGRSSSGGDGLASGARCCDAEVCLDDVRACVLVTTCRGSRRSRDARAVFTLQRGAPSIRRRWRRIRRYQPGGGGDRGGRDPRHMRKLAVLVAEDNGTNQMVISKILARRASREDCRQRRGRARCDARGGFDIVLMDVNMPVMNGIEATKLYRFASIGRCPLPIVALTADATPEACARCKDAGMDSCATKPIEPARLIEIIESLVVDEAAGTETALPAEGVTHIAEHPKFRPSAAQSITPETLSDLEAIGGKEFVAELAGQFTIDAANILAELDAAARGGDVTAFREWAHALRSSAANIGAHGIYDMCVAWRQIGTGELASRGGDHVRRLGEEIERVRMALAEHLGTEATPARPMVEDAVGEARDAVRPEVAPERLVRVDADVELVVGTAGEPRPAVRFGAGARQTVRFNRAGGQDLGNNRPSARLRPFRGRGCAQLICWLVLAKNGRHRNAPHRLQPQAAHLH